MSINNWPKEERPREKLLTRGARALSDAELLAIFIRCGIKGKTAVDIARDLLQQFGSIKKLLDLEQKKFCRSATGLGAAKYVQLQAALELSKRYLSHQLNHSKQIGSIAGAKLYCSIHLSQHQQEVFAVALLDNHHHLIHYAEMFYGTVNRATIYPREVVKIALQHNAAAIVLMHNHISGSLHPSTDDHLVTQQLQQALKLIDVKVLDHIIVGNNECFSFAEAKLI